MERALIAAGRAAASTVNKRRNKQQSTNRDADHEPDKLEEPTEVGKVCRRKKEIHVIQMAIIHSRENDESGSSSTPRVGTKTPGRRLQDESAGCEEQGVIIRSVHTPSPDMDHALEHMKSAEENDRFEAWKQLCRGRMLR